MEKNHYKRSCKYTNNLVSCCASLCLSTTAVATAAGLFISILMIHAQEKSPAPQAGVPEKREEIGNPMSKSREIMQQFAKASKKVNEQPEIAVLREKLMEAQKAYQTAFEVAMAKEDPEILEKWKTLQSFHTMPGGGPRPETQPSGYGKLSEEEKKKLTEARSQAMEDTEVKTARKKRNEAKTEEERKEAETEYKQALRKAMIRIDDKVNELLEKMEGKTEKSQSIKPGSQPDQKDK